MLRCDALVVGGGPAGSTSARILHQAGWNVIVVDGARFPRDKVCAGWLTPDVFRLLDLDPADYRATGLTLQEITGFRTGLVDGRAVETRYARVVSYAIRRCEFDDFLLRRSGARVCDGTRVTALRREGDVWVVNESFSAPVVVGAGGHFCPVARHLRGGAADGHPVVAQEAEFPVGEDAGSVAGATPELFFCRDLDGYGWCVRKGDYVNVGIGRRRSDGFDLHKREFVAFVEQSGRVPRASIARWRGHAYLASGAGMRPLVGDGLLLSGDAAGLAYPESGEGIKPAIAAGRLAAETLIAAGGRWPAERLRPYEDAIRRRHPPAPRSPARLRGAIAAAGRMLLQSPLFTRRVVLDRWFLRIQEQTRTA